MCRCSGRVYFGRKFDNDQEQLSSFVKLCRKKNQIDKRFKRLYERESL